MRMALFFCSLFLWTEYGYSQNSDSESSDLVKQSVYFGGGSFFIDEIQSDLIKDFIEGVEDLNNHEIILFSHTDNIGSREYNKWLSEMRSQAVYARLLQLGIPKEQIEIKDFGYENPLYANNSSGGRMMNRRVDIILIPIVF